ncbi:hypothetical protein [Phaeobacter sp. HF9A]|uniref:hypothetical protein n=1 Tax=Phaeobacter sp. HF9A TaxID=2721561 RepID=UPI0014313D2F|nr:hypothetical protein [Phaeobacter sp. HF9A]NIZ14722.1 hypothetical protein [Phaeobacter sp. HF9A]
MPPITERGGVKFDESLPENFVPIEKLSTQLNSGFGQDQLKSLRDVKEAMAKEALSLGGNYIASFTYGQKNGGVLQQLWSVDNVLWYGEGVVGNLSK